jgi:multidrug efflux pump subunit AcrB
MEYDASLYYAVGDRLRPIFMSVGTSVLGLFPLAVLPGKGAELYQGLEIALTGGLALSTFAHSDSNLCKRWDCYRIFNQEEANKSIN